MYKALLKMVRDQFDTTQSQTNGLIALIGLLLLVSAALSWGHYLLPDAGAVINAADQQRLDSLYRTLETADQPLVTAALFAFDPNRLPVDSLQLLGMPAHLANRLDRYRRAGGEFRTRTDLQRLYGLPDSLYQALAPWITLPDAPPERHRPARAQRPSSRPSPRPRPFKPRYPERTPPVAFDLNRADTVLLRRVKGIGAKRAEVLVSVRERLGGFVSLDQLDEVYVLDSASRAELRRYARIEPDFRPRRVALNQVTAEALGRHPYVSQKLAQVIVSYRQQHGPFATVDALRHIRILSAEQLEKLRPYVTVNPPPVAE